MFCVQLHLCVIVIGILVQWSISALWLFFSAASIFIFKAPKKCSAIRIIQFRQQYRKPKISHCENNNYADQLMDTDTGLGCWRSFCITGLVMGEVQRRATNLIAFQLIYLPCGHCVVDGRQMICHAKKSAEAKWAESNLLTGIGRGSIGCMSNGYDDQLIIVAAASVTGNQLC